MLQSNKKLTILCILDILKEYSDENHPLTQAEIVKKLNTIYCVECERKSVGTSIDSLTDFGYEIVKLERGGCYLAKREFEPSEIKFLIDAVLATRNISSKHAGDLASKINAFQSCHGQKFFRNIHGANEIPRTINKEFFFNIDIINEAIDKGKKIEFVYNFYDSNRNLKPRSEKPYIINPYFMLYNNGKYYLVCNREGLTYITNYRLDYITGIRILEEPIKSAATLPDYENGLDVTKYANENIYMFGDQAVTATLKLYDNWAVSNLLDWFDKNARVYQKQNGDRTETFADITVSELAIIYWSIQYGQGVELISPPATRQKIAEMAEKIAERYRK